MKDSLLLPVQSNGGNRHTDLKVINSGGTHAEANPVASSQTSQKGFSPTAFSETFNNSLKLSDEDVAKLTNPEGRGADPLKTQTELSFLAPLHGNPESPLPLSNPSYHIAEKVVDAATPLAIAQFTQSDTETISFAKTSSETISLQNGEKADQTKVITELTPLPVSRDGLIGVDTGLEKDNVGAPNTPSNLFDTRSFETIKGQHLAALSYPLQDTTHNFRGALTQEDLQGLIANASLSTDSESPRNLDTELETLTPVMDGSESIEKFPSSASTLPINQDILGDLWVTSETPAALLTPRPVPEAIGFNHPPSAEYILSEDAIRDFRGVLTQEDLQGLFRNLIPSSNSHAPQDIEAGLETLSPIIDSAEGADITEDLTVSINLRAEVIEDAVEPIINNGRNIPNEGLPLAQNTLAQNNNDGRAPDSALADTDLQVPATDLSDTSASTAEIETIDTPQTARVDSAVVASAPDDNKRPEIADIRQADLPTSREVDAPNASRPTVGNDNVAPDISETASLQAAPVEILTTQDNDAPVEVALATPPATENETITLEDGQTPDVAAIQTPVQGLALNPIEEISLANSRGTVSLSDIQLAANRPALAAAVDTGKKPNPRDTREIDLDIDVEVDASSSDIRDVEIQTDEIDPSDLYFDQVDSEFETAKSLPQSGQTTLSPLAMSTTSSPMFQPIMGLGGEVMSPLAAQAQSLSPSSSTLAQSPNVRQAVVTSVSEAILTAKETPKGIVVQLDPPEMGRVYIDFLFEGDNNVTVVMKSDSADSQAILKERQDHFQALLKDSGFDNVTMSFEQQSSSDGDGSGPDGHGKDINIGLSGQSLDDQSDSYNQPIYQVTDETIRLDMRL